VIVAALVQDAKDNINSVSVLATVAGLAVAVFGWRLLDEGHRVRSKGVVAVFLSFFGVLVVAAQLAVMGAVAWQSVNSQGSFEPWLFLHDVYFGVLIVIAAILLVLFFKALRYTSRATD
jgi:hypothetical protein